MLYDFAMPNLPSNKPAEIAERIRRNHALEHATLHMLAERTPNLRGGGRAQHNGFYLYGNFDLEQVAWAADEAIKRMCAGQSRLAIHPGCGTNLVTSGFLTGGLALLMARLTGKRARWHEQLTGAILGGLVGSFLAMPLGPWVQANVTTSANMQGVSVRGIRRSSLGRLQGFFVETEIR